MPEPVESGLLRDFFIRLGGLLPVRARLVVVGGSAMALLGNPRTTVDFDFIGGGCIPGGNIKIRPNIGPNLRGIIIDLADSFTFQELFCKILVDPHFKFRHGGINCFFPGFCL